MTQTDRIRSLAALLEGTSIGLLELSGPDGVLRLHAGQPAAADPVLHVVPSPSVGTFRLRHPLQDAPLVRQGDPVQAGDVLGLIEVGTLLLHVLAPASSVVATVLAADGAVVGYGTPLFQLAEAST